MDSLTCSNCGATLAEASGPTPEDRAACPICGSTARTINVTVSEIVGVQATASAGVIYGELRSIAGISDLLVQTVIVAGDRTAEGRLIEAVALPWFDIIEILKHDPHIAYQIPASTWEEIVA